LKLNDNALVANQIFNAASKLTLIQQFLKNIILFLEITEKTMEV